MTRQVKPKAWTPQMKDLIERFTKEDAVVPPFELRPGSTVIDPAKFRAAILLEIAGGPGGPRAILGGLESDLRDFFNFFDRRPAPGIEGKAVK